jgi:hypothetical protein
MSAPTPGNGPGFHVDIPALHAYASGLGKYREQSAKIKDMVGQADVGNQSWGVVGIFTKQGYTDTLRELQTLMDAVSKGLEAAEAKITSAANTYQGTEDDHVEMFNGIKVFFDGPKGGKP